jgi:hypothetical protein
MYHKPNYKVETNMLRNTTVEMCVAAECHRRGITPVSPSNPSLEEHPDFVRWKRQASRRWMSMMQQNGDERAEMSCPLTWQYDVSMRVIKSFMTRGELRCGKDLVLLQLAMRKADWCERVAGNRRCSWRRARPIGLRG